MQNGYKINKFIIYIAFAGNVNKLFRNLHF